jgi:hypothetical protein
MNSTRLIKSAFIAIFALTVIGPQGRDAISQDGQPKGTKDPHVVRNPGDFKENPKFVSAPTLGQPIYACSGFVTVQNFIPGAKIEVFIDGAAAPNPSFIGNIPHPARRTIPERCLRKGKLSS